MKDLVGFSGLFEKFDDSRLFSSQSIHLSHSLILWTQLLHHLNNFNGVGVFSVKEAKFGFVFVYFQARVG